MKIKTLALTTTIAAIVTACSTHKGFVDYKELGVFSSDNAGNQKFTDVGPISTDASSWVWSSCDVVATNAVRELLDIAKVRGANTVYKITFDSENGRVTTPTCYKRWGWFALYVVGGLGPWMTHTAVEGIAANIANPDKHANAVMLTPNSDTLELAKNYVDSLGINEVTVDR